jgi:hypothetical protein
MPHERGLIEVRLDRTPAGGIRARVSLPEGLSGTFEWKGQQTRLHSGTQEITY